MKVLYTILLSVLPGLIGYSQELDSLLQVFEVQNGVDKVRTCQSISSKYRRTNDYSHALEYGHKSLQLSQQLNADVLVAESYNLIALVYEQTENLEMAKKYLMISLEMFRKERYLKGETSVLINLALVETKTEDKIKWTQQAISAANEIKDTSKLLLSYNNLSYDYFLDGQYDKSLDAVESGLNIIQSTTKNRYQQRKAQLQINQCENYIALKRYEEALLILDSISVNEQLLSLREKADLYRMYADANEQLGKYQEALDYNKMERQLKDSLFYLKSNEEVLKRTIKSEKKVLEQENELLSKEQKIGQLELKRQKLKNAVYLIVSGLLFVVLLVVGYSYRAVRSKNRRLVATNQEMVNIRSKSSKSKRKAKVESKSTDDGQNELISQLIDRLESLLEEEEVYTQTGLTMDYFAKKLGTNRTYLSTAVNRLNPSGFNDLINERRIMKACELLADPEFSSYTIQFIANEVGFHSQPTFNTAFKKFTGVTPSFYLRELKKMESQK